MIRWFETLASWWAPGTTQAFRQRCASALTHPVTVVSLAVLVLNDVLFKSLWPGSWWTGKLSDLAWMVFAPPLLAFLLSWLTRGNERAEKASWIAAYVGLPLLYAAFNTFEPVHHWIMQGLSIASGGTAGSPLDVTDSLVIPLGMGIAVWVWRRRVVGPAGQRLRLGLLVAGVAALASVASSQLPPDPGITKVRISPDGTIYAGRSLGMPSAGDKYLTIVNPYASVDGGLNWTADSAVDRADIKPAPWNAETPRGRYEINGTRIMRVDADGRSEEVYSSAYLQEAGNVWVQKHDSDLQYDSELATRPLRIVYDPSTGNLIVAMGRQGVLVGTPDERWERFAVGGYSPTNFSFTAKTRFLLSRLDFWALAVTLPLAMAGTALIFPGIDANGPEHGTPRRRRVVGLLAIVAAVVVLGLILMTFLIGGRFAFGPIGIFGLLVLAPFLAGIAICTMPLRRKVRRGLALSIGVLAVIGSCIMLVMFGGTNADDNFYPLFFTVISIPAFTLGTTAMAISCPPPKYWPTVGAALAGMIVMITLAFMLWLHLGIALALAKVSAFVLAALVAFVLAGYLGRKAVRPDPETLCPRCQQANSLLALKCYTCGLPLKPDTTKLWAD